MFNKGLSDDAGSRLYTSTTAPLICSDQLRMQDQIHLQLPLAAFIRIPFFSLI